MLKRFLSSLLALAVCCTLVPIKAANAENLDVSAFDEKYIMLVDASNPSSALYGVEKNSNERCYPASTTKILTCILALENGNLDDVVDISAKAADFNAKYNSLMGVSEGQEYTLRDLLYGLMLVSGNDAAIAIAEHIGGGVDEFVRMMNSKAASIGMSSSHFVTPHGKHDNEHYTTARDMALLTSYALQNQTFRDIIATKQYTATEASRGNTQLELINANRLLVDAQGDGFTPQSCLYEYAIGVKTGDTDQAGKCLIAAASRGGVTLVAVLLGGTGTTIEQKPAEKEPFNARRFLDAINIFDYAFNQMLETITVQELVNLGMPTDFEVQVQNYDSDDEQAGKLSAKANVDTAQSFQLMSPFMSELRLSAPQLATPKLSNVIAPISEGQVIGSVEYSLNGTVLFTSELVATRSVKEGLVSTETAPAGALDSLLGTAVFTPAQSGGNQGFWVWILVAAVLVILIVLAVAMYVVYVRRERERKRRLAAKKRKRMQQQAALADNRRRQSTSDNDYYNNGRSR